MIHTAVFWIEEPELKERDYSDEKTGGWKTDFMPAGDQFLVSYPGQEGAGPSQE